MAVLYSNDFDSLSHASTIAAFTPIAGGDWLVLQQSTAPASWPAARGTHSYGNNTASAESNWNGNTSLTTSGIRTAAVLRSGAYIGHRIRASAGNGYSTYFEFSSGNLQAVVVRSSAGEINETVSSGFVVPATLGDVVHFETWANGSSIECRVWVNSGSRPASPTALITSSAHPSGAVGITRVLGSGTYATVDDLVIFDVEGDNGFFYSSGTSATANGVTVTSSASIVVGTTSGQAGATATGRTFTVNASLSTIGSATGEITALLNFQAAGLEFGRRTGAGISTFSLDSGSNYRYSVHADALTIGAALLTSAAIALDSAGKLPDLRTASLTPGSTYRVVAIRQADGEAAIFRMAAAA